MRKKEKERQRERENTKYLYAVCFIKTNSTHLWGNIILILSKAKKKLSFDWLRKIFIQIKSLLDKKKTKPNKHQ